MEKDKLGYLSLAEAAKLCPHSQKYLNLRARQKKLKAIKIGRNWVTKKEWVEEYLKRMEKQNSQRRRNPALPPENLPIGRFPKFKPKKIKTQPSLVFVMAAIFVLLVTSVAFSKEGIINTFQILVKETIKTPGQIFSAINSIAAEVSKTISDKISQASLAIVSPPKPQSPDGIFEGIVNTFKDYGKWISEKTSDIAWKISDSLEKAYQFVISPWREKPLVVEKPEIGVEEIESLKGEIKEIKEKGVQIREITKEVEVTKVTKVEPVKEITKEVIKVSDEAVKEIREEMKKEITDLRTNIQRELSVRPAVTTAVIYSQPNPDKLYKEGGNVYVQTASSGNVIIEAASNTNISGQQIIIDATSATTPLITLNDDTQVLGTFTVGTSTTIITDTLLTTPNANITSNLTVGGTFTLTGTSTLASPLTITSTTTPQLSVRYDSTNTLDISTSSAGEVTLAASGSLIFPSQAIFRKSPTLAHTFVAWSPGVADSNVANATLYINPATAVADANLLGLAVDGSVKFLVDAEGDVFVNSLTAAGSVTVGATTVSTLTVENNTTLGDASTDWINTVARFKSSLTPQTDNTYDLGENTTPLRWKTGYFGTSVSTGNLIFDLTNDVTIQATNPATARTYTIPDFGSNDTFVGLAASQTLTNKTLSTGSTWNGNVITTTYGGTGLSSIGTANQLLGVNSGATGLEYKTIQGTTNQITVSHAAGSITLSTPQDIATASSPTFAGLTLSGLTTDGVVKVASGVLSSEAQLATLRGGTGLSTFTAGGRLLYSTDASTLTTLAIGAANTVLTSSGTAPQWSTNIAVGALPTGGNWDISSDLTIETPTLFIGANGGSYAGKVGIGSTAPWAKLDIYTSSGEANAKIETGGTGSGASALLYFEEGDTSGWFIGQDSYYSDAFTITKNADPWPRYLTITLGGNVGIGTTTPGTFGSQLGNFDKYLDVLGSTQAAAVGVGTNLSADGTLGDISFYNTAIGGTGVDNRVGILRFSRSGANDSGKFQLWTKNAGTFVEALTILPAGNVGIGTTGPDAKLDILSTTAQLRLSYTDGSVYTDFTTGSGGTLTIDPSDASNTVLIGPSGTGKLTVTTIDPLYNIGGTSYATYVPSIIGVKEEITGVVKLQPTSDPSLFKYVIDFDNLEQGSDLWLFKKVVNWGEGMENLVVLLSSENNARISYKKDSANNRLVIYGDSPVEVSYRLTAPRFDYEQWPTLVEENNQNLGLSVPEPSLDNRGKLNINGIDAEDAELAKLLNGLKIEQITLSPLLLNFTDLVRQALASLGLAIKNSIASLKELVVEKLTVKELCLEGDDGEKICVTKSQLKEILEKNQVGSGGYLQEQPPAEQPSIEEPSVEEKSVEF